MKYVSMKKIIPGMVLARNVLKENGQIILRKGLTLDEFYIDSIKRHNIQTVCVEEDKDKNRGEVTAIEKEKLKTEIRPGKNYLFKYCMTDKYMKQLLEAVILNEMWNRWNNE